ncbi:MAG: hypothetical protein PHR10_01055 [Sphaerochaetaceae bacterium]|jgi:hypothetical protein|nr:hypothetical protein [Sphaerochaetaceae bacterium]MDY0370900.1 hypothetical protein [Sphaerochaetaceae bacterium]
MKNLKRTLGVVLVIMMLIVPVFGAGEEAQLTLTTHVGETIENTGVRITENVADVSETTAFDSIFFASNSVVTVETTKDNSLFATTGEFAVLVRRQISGQIGVSITAQPLKNGTSYLNYTLLSTSNLEDNSSNTIAIGETAGTGQYKTTSGAGDWGVQVVRDQNVFTYTIPADLNASAGTYTSTIKFALIAP